jgi:predicted membrane GTPase involved in stress response
MVKYQKDIVSTIYKTKNIFNIQRSCDDLEMRIMISVRFDLDPSLQNINHDNF